MKKITIAAILSILLTFTIVAYAVEDSIHPNGWFYIEPTPFTVTIEAEDENRVYYLGDTLVLKAVVRGHLNMAAYHIQWYESIDEEKEDFFAIDGANDWTYSINLNETNYNHWWKVEIKEN